MPLKLISLGIWFSLFGVAWVMCSMVRDSLLSWHDSFVGKKQVVCACFGHLWKEINKRAFENSKQFDKKIKAYFMKKKKKRFG